MPRHILAKLAEKRLQKSSLGVQHLPLSVIFEELVSVSVEFCQLLVVLNRYVHVQLEQCSLLRKYASSVAGSDCLPEGGIVEDTEGGCLTKPATLDLYK